MNQKFNKSGPAIKEKGPVWNIDVGVYSRTLSLVQFSIRETKLWKIKVILN